MLSLQENTPDVRSTNENGEYSFFSVSDDVDRIKPERGDVEKFWEQYQNCPLIRIPINQYAEDVTAPGVRVISDDDTVSDTLESWLESSSIIAGEADQNFSDLLYAIIVQEAVRGSVLVEKVPMRESDGIFGFKTISVATVSAYTYENQSVLIRPEDSDLENVKTTPDGEAAAYGQWDSGAIGAPFDDDPVYLSQNDIIKQVRDPDTSDIWGTSIVQPVSQHVDELQTMLHDTSDAVHNKAYPHWMFKMGEPSGDPQDPRAGVWPEEEIQKLRKKHQRGEFETGNKDFVPGDVDLDIYEGSVPEIEDLLNWYVEVIVSAMPVPRAKIGFAGDINRDIVSDQIEQYDRKVENKRRTLEDAFTPVLREKARELGFESMAESVELKIDEPEGNNPLTREGFEPSEFSELARGLNNISGGNPQEIVEADEVREMLGLATGDARDESEEDAFVEDADGIEDEGVTEEVASDFEDLFGEPVVPDSTAETSVALDDDGLGLDGDASSGDTEPSAAD